MAHFRVYPTCGVVLDMCPFLCLNEFLDFRWGVKGQADHSDFGAPLFAKFLDNCLIFSKCIDWVVATALIPDVYDQYLAAFVLDAVLVRA